MKYFPSTTCVVCGKPIPIFSMNKIRMVRPYLWCSRKCFLEKPKKIIDLEKKFNMDIVDVLKYTIARHRNLHTQSDALGISIPYLYTIIRKYCGQEYLLFMANHATGKNRHLYAKKCNDKNIECKGAREIERLKIEEARIKNIKRMRKVASVNAWIQLRKLGIAWDKAAARLGMSTTTLSEWQKQLGIKFLSNKTIVSLCKKWWSFRSIGLSASESAKIVGIPIRTLSRWSKRVGIKKTLDKVM